MILAGKCAIVTAGGGAGGLVGNLSSQCPGRVPLSAARGPAPEALRRFIDAEDIAEMATYLASDTAHMVSGQIIAVDGNTESLATVPL